MPSKDKKIKYETEKAWRKRNPIYVKVYARRYYLKKKGIQQENLKREQSHSFKRKRDKKGRFI